MGRWQRDPGMASPRGGPEGGEQLKTSQFFSLTDASWVSEGETLSDHGRSSQLMVFQAAATGCWERCLPGVWILLGPSDLTSA